MGCYIGLTHTITHHLHLTEAKTETIPLDFTYVYVCARKKGVEQKRIRSACVCVSAMWLLLKWISGRAEVKSRLYWIIKRNRAALITALLFSLLLAPDTDRAEKTVKQRLQQRKRHSSTVCVQPAHSLPEPRFSSFSDHNIVLLCIAVEQSCSHRPWLLPPTALQSFAVSARLTLDEMY